MIPFRITRASGLLFTLLTASAVYAVSVRNGFAYDDLPLIVLDPRVHSLGNLRAIVLQPYWPVGGQELAIWRPLTTLSFAVDWALSGGAAAWFHIANVLWHLAVCALVLLLLWELFAPAAALAGALLFAVHPVHVEAVANVVGRGDVIAAALILAACLAWVRRTRDGKRPAGHAILLAALFASALLAKESAVVLPALLPVLDAARGQWALNRESALAYARSVGPVLAGLLLVLGGYLVLRGAVLDAFAPERVHAAADVLERRSHLLLTSLQAWPHYLRLLLFPRSLLIDYGPRIIMPVTTWSSAAVLGLSIVVGLVLGGLLALVRGRGLAALGLLWLPITVLPVSNFLFTAGILVAERTLYLPSFAGAIAAAAVTGLAVVASPARRRIALALGTASLVLLAARTTARVPEWESTERIFARQARDRPDSYRAHWILGRAARQAGDRVEARRRYTQALLLWPFHEAMVVEAAAFAVQDGRLLDAREIAGSGITRWRENLELHRLFAAVSLDLGDTLAARIAVDSGLRIDSRDTLLNQMRGALAAPRRETSPDAH